MGSTDTLFDVLRDRMFLSRNSTVGGVHVAKEEQGDRKCVKMTFVKSKAY